MRAPTERHTPDLAIIGAGSGGLSVAAGAAQMGASVVLIEAGEMGGDCLNYGCVPSKAILAAAKKAHAHRHSAAFGVADHEPEVDYAAVMDHVHKAIATIAPHDSQERFEGFGITVIRAKAQFISPTEVEAGGHIVAPRRFVIATGSSPMVPPIPGLGETPYLTNESLWENRTLPEHLIVIGGGPIGLEQAQAHARLGSRVTVLEAFKALAKDDPELAAVALDGLRAEGIDIREGAKVTGARKTETGVALTLEDGTEIEGSHLLVAAGRRANVDLNLEAANVTYTPRGIEVDKSMRSPSNRKVYAIGDVAGGLQFTHVANYHAGLVIRNALFRMPVTASTAHIPWVTYTDPEIAQAGMTEAEAREAHGDVLEVHRFPFADNDRAVAEGRREGLAKVMVGKKGKILGASIVGPSAGELILPWAMALANGLKIGAMANTVAAYPTLSEVSKRAAGAYYAPRLFESGFVKTAVKLLAKLG
ncbi:MAG: FAD-dependent oxidoreductase [Pseudomonadota bacterium]